MKKSTKYIIGVTSVLSLVVIGKVTSKAVKKTTESIDKMKYKMLVREKLKDDQKFLAIANDLDDEQLKTMIGILEKIESNSREEQLSSYMESAKGNVDEIKNRILDAFEDLKEGER
ncbi:hypothetical protein ACWOAH_04855 [Vagococcus vulneris]|uniref:Uncharacterized protein n=1 Tax=Vagococcus vulneris TaxID=1977869 RepID=A0A430A006_9ENTE|nr:hypothetical protein [Vagococcus vulneris]RST99593.1 hypothetical protein CBF37_04510 [Vagococcus vulneris]